MSTITAAPDLVEWEPPTVKEIQRDIADLRRYLIIGELAEDAHSESGKEDDERSLPAVAAIARRAYDELGYLLQHEESGLAQALKRVHNRTSFHQLAIASGELSAARQTCVAILLLADALRRDSLPSGVDSTTAYFALANFSHSIRNRIDAAEKALPSELEFAEVAS